VFRLKYFGKDACLAQSPQLYKQMAICADFDRVFEIGPVFRAENSVSYRHLCEFTGLDLEMALEPNDNGEYDYKQTTNLIWKLLKHIQTYLYTTHKEIEYIRLRTKFVDLLIPENPVYVTYKDAVKMLNSYNDKNTDSRGQHMEETDDLNNIAEKTLGMLIKQITGSDMFILTGYPSKVRPFYTMLNKDDPKFSNSYDIILNGTEISSGTQRVHEYDKLLEKVTESGINPASLYGYLDAFKYGCNPHAGCGLGLERLVILLFGLENVRQASFCPRDPGRLLP
jgi:aspartyl-tRNA synthetase